MSGFHFIPAGGFDDSGRKAKYRADEAIERARGAVDDLNDLRAQVDRLQMICEAMWSIMKDRLGASEDELLRLVEEIDLRMVCLFCGAKNVKSTVF
jgi:hypothetical protein